MLFYFLLFGVLIFCIYIWLSRYYKYWEERGVPNPKPSFLFGNLTDAVLLKKSFGQVYNKYYDDYPSLSYFGFYKIGQRAVVVKDPELIKEVLVKSFNSFHNNDFIVSEKTDPLFGKNPAVLTGSAWKVSRSQVTPSFTPKRIKAMFPLMDAVCNNLVTYLKETPMGKYGLEGKDLAGKFTTDMVASCAFGFEANSFKDPNAEFRQMGLKLLNPSLFNAFKFFVFFVFPQLTNLFPLKGIPNDLGEYFTGVIKHSLDYRKKNNVKRDDFLDAMSELKNKLGEDVFGDVHITAHALGFFLDGYETSSIVIAFTLYELGLNLDIQNKLSHEIDETLRENGGKFSYDTIHGMTYLDQVITETLRKHPVMLFTAKVCTEQFTLPPPSGEGQPVVIEPETRIIVPSLSIHMDPKYYPDPERFDPERFSEENAALRTKSTYLAFGEGPRACLGQRFGLAQTKMAVAYVIANFEVRVNKKTASPIEIDPCYFLNTAKGGLWLNFTERSS